MIELLQQLQATVYETSTTDGTSVTAVDTETAIKLIIEILKEMNKNVS